MYARVLVMTGPWLRAMESRVLGRGGERVARSDGNLRGEDPGRTLCSADESGSGNHLCCERSYGTVLWCSPLFFPFFLLPPATSTSSVLPQIIIPFLSLADLAASYSARFLMSTIMQPQPSATATPTDPKSPPNTQHTYGTRIRQNILIKPSARLRQSPDPPSPARKIVHKSPPENNTSSSNNFPQFPPPHIVLHPDDANSRVFLAIGRSFLSVVRPYPDATTSSLSDLPSSCQDNRAMTIKDLAEMTVNFGLVCQKCVSWP